MKTGIFKSKPERNRSFVYLYIVIMLFIEITSFLFTFPCNVSYLTINVLVIQEDYLLIIQLAIFFTITVFFLYVWLKNPGYIEKPKGLSLIQVLEDYPPFRVCPFCEIPKPKRSKHCDYCNKCVKVFDHHCPWVNNCVGAGNHGGFLIFILSMTIICIYQLALNIMVLLQSVVQHNLLYKMFDWMDHTTIANVKPFVCAV